jgi:hypothetical protein
MPSTGVPTSPRRYNYLLGGKDNFAADRESGDTLKRVFPAVELAAWENRLFMRRVVRYLAAECGIRQFVDIGVGLPFGPNVHEVAQAVHPDARIVYVDNDPVVAVHARALLTGTRPGVRIFVDGDLRRPEKITADPVLRGVLDLTRPVAVLLFAVLHCITDDEATRAIRHLAGAVAAGSYLALSHVSFDAVAPDVAARLSRAVGLGEEFRPRSHAALTGLLEGLDPIAPGLVPVVDWHPDLDPPPVHPDTIVRGGVLRVGSGHRETGGEQQEQPHRKISDRRPQPRLAVARTAASGQRVQADSGERQTHGEQHGRHDPTDGRVVDERHLYQQHDHRDHEQE